ncbi:MAG: DUF5050 domain-containing protein [Bacillota bacterium]|nr:DUF5050 domain-containing protein [Bacillota bacterium]
MNIKKVLVLILSLLLIISLIGCGSDDEVDQPQEEEDNEEAENDEVTSEEGDSELTPEEVIAALEAEESQGTDEGDENEEVAEESQEEEENQGIEEEYLNYFYYYYGNTSGNLANEGYALFDFDNQKHIISMDMGVYTFDPKDESITELFNLEEKASAKYLNSTEEWMYYINSQTGDLVRRKKDDYSLVEKIYEGRVDYLYINQGVAYILTQGEEYSEMVFYKEKDDRFYETYANEISHMTSYFSNVFYYTNKTLDPSQYKVSHYSGSGKTALIKFDESFIDIESVLAYEQFGTALIIQREGVSGFYIYRQKELLHSITTEDGFKNFSSVNFDDRKFYFIADGGEGRHVYSVDKESYDLEKLVPVPEDGVNLNIINNWMYLQKMNSNQVYQLKLGDSEFKLLEI